MDLPDGRHYGINVWTYGFLATAVAQSIRNKQHLQGAHLVAPDLFVKELTRECIEATIADLLSVGGLEVVLNPSVLGKPAID